MTEVLATLIGAVTRLVHQSPPHWDTETIGCFPSLSGLPARDERCAMDRKIGAHAAGSCIRCMAEGKVRMCTSGGVWRMGSCGVHGTTSAGQHEQDHKGMK
jgi:hypothetical protein